MLKRLVAAVFVSALAIAPMATAASAAPAEKSSVKTVKVVKPVDGGATTQRIDWE